MRLVYLPASSSTLPPDTPEPPVISAGRYKGSLFLYHWLTGPVFLFALHLWYWAVPNITLVVCPPHPPLVILCYMGASLIPCVVAAMFMTLNHGPWCCWVVHSPPSPPYSSCLHVWMTRVVAGACQGSCRCRSGDY